VQGSSGGGGPGPSPSALYFWTRNRSRFIARNAPDPVRRAVAHSYTLGTRVVRMGQAALAGRGGEARLIARALIDGYFRRATGDTYPRSAVTVSRPAGEARV